ncbi:hypothetical protein ACMGDH_01350 [Sphingomonas sp. DT-207]|uniref:hypothetical protein n=1 Tax=Sphingomonas sp. DT-207 TaxID=3396167 RepID=UPI003F197A08
MRLQPGWISCPAVRLQSTTSIALGLLEIPQQTTEMRHRSALSSRRTYVAYLTNKIGRQSAALGKEPIEWLPRAQITARFIDKAIDFVRRSRERAWFAQLWLTDVHSPWVPSAEELAPVKGKGRTPREENFLGAGRDGRGDRSARCGTGRGGRARRYVDRLYV